MKVAGVSATTLEASEALTVRNSLADSTEFSARARAQSQHENNAEPTREGNASQARTTVNDVLAMAITRGDPSICVIDVRAAFVQRSINDANDGPGNSEWA